MTIETLPTFPPRWIATRRWGYNFHCGVRNHMSGPRPDSCGLFVCAPAWLPSMVGRARNSQYAPPFSCGSELPTALHRASCQFRNHEEATHGR